MMMLARNEGLFSPCGIADCARRLGDCTCVGVIGFLLGVEPLAVFGTITLGTFCEAPRLVGYLS